MTTTVENGSSKELLDDHRTLEPPDPIPNSEVKRCIADGSVGSPHVRVGHRQALTPKPQISNDLGFFYACKKVELRKSKTQSDHTGDPGGSPMLPNSI